MMNSILMELGSLLYILVVLAALDSLRSVHPFKRPVLSLSFYLITLGAFGSLAELAKGCWVSPWVAAMHPDIIGYAWIRWEQIFYQDWRWDGAGRRRC